MREARTATVNALLATDHSRVARVTPYVSRFTALYVTGEARVAMVNGLLATIEAVAPTVNALLAAGAGCRARVTA